MHATQPHLPVLATRHTPVDPKSRCSFVPAFPGVGREDVGAQASSDSLFAKGRVDCSGHALIVVTSWPPYSRPGNPEVRPWAASAAVVACVSRERTLPLRRGADRLAWFGITATLTWTRIALKVPPPHPSKLRLL